MVLRRAKQKQISFGYCDTRTGQRVYPPPPVNQMTDLLPEQLPPQQKPAFNPQPGEDDMNFQLSCIPPLGQATTVAKDLHNVKFTVVLETPLKAGNGAQVCLWHNHNGDSDWGELPLKPSPKTSDVFLFRQPHRRNVQRQCFTAELQGLPKHGQVVSFTYKVRLDESEGWRWINESIGIEDGELHYQAPADFTKHTFYDLNHFFHNISTDIKQSQKVPETDNTQLWELTCPVNAAKGEDSGYQHHQLGRAKRCSKWFALVRLWSPWLAPRQGKGGAFSLDKDGVLLSFLRTDGLHVVVLGISGIEDNMSTFLNDEYSNIIIKGRNDRETTGTSRVIVAVAETFEVANAAVFYHARKVVAEYSNTTAQSEIQTLMDDNVKPEWLEEWYDGLTYCTWNGLGQKLTASAILKALDDLSENEIKITNLIIDDNWQSLSSGQTQFKKGWSDFEANSEGFPDGMKATTAKIRERHPNVNHIAVWHAIMGYWGGIDPDGNIAKTYKTIGVEKEPGVAQGEFTVVAAEDIARMYDDFYRFLSLSGIDAVKTDAQFFLDMLVHAPDRRTLITEYQDAWTIAHLRHLGSRAISCMSQFPQALFHSQLPRNKPRLLVRNSDDFFPAVEASHAWHIFCNAHNSVFMQHLNVLPDWDMFQTSHEWASFHAAARCVSGGPIYFTDVPGEHDVTLIRQMTASTPRGTTVILRPHIIGRAMNVYNDYSAQAVLKIGTYVGMAQTGTGILGVFNVTSEHLSELIHLNAFPGTENGEYVITSFITGECSKPLARSSPYALVGVELGKRGWDVLTAFALRPFKLHSQSISVAMMGLLGKMTGCAAVTGCEMYVETSGRVRIWVSLKALGVLGLWISDLETKSVEKDFMIMIFGKPIPVHCVSKNSASEKVLEIDVERAWKENGEQAGWSNEVTLEIFIG